MHTALTYVGTLIRVDCGPHHLSRSKQITKWRIWTQKSTSRDTISLTASMAEAASDVAARLGSLLRISTANPQHVPGVVLQVVDRCGRTIYSGAAGLRGLDSTVPMTTHSVFWIASCTKLVSAVALMILVEQGLADLDSADLLEEVVPEMKTVQILEDGKLRPKRNRITLRMLMTHVGSHVSVVVTLARIADIVSPRRQDSPTPSTTRAFGETTSKWIHPGTSSRENSLAYNNRSYSSRAPAMTTLQVSAVVICPMTLSLQCCL